MSLNDGAWWRFEWFMLDRWPDGWKRPGYYRPRIYRLNISGPAPHAVKFQFMRFQALFWYRDRKAAA